MIDFETGMAWFRDRVRINPQPYIMPRHQVGRVIVDANRGFMTAGCGPLAPPPEGDPVIEAAEQVIIEQARQAAARGDVILALSDCHDAEQVEFPYPPHCQVGSGDELLVDGLRWLEEHSSATVIYKRCFDALIATMHEEGNQVIDWVNRHHLEVVVIDGGICSEICVQGFVNSLCSARTRGLMPQLRDVVVYVPGVVSYHLPEEAVESLGLPPEALHERDIFHHMGLASMARHGALLADHLQED